MKCPVCGAKTSVMDSRPTSRSVWRRRQCVECGYRWTTYETSTEVGDFNKIVRTAKASLSKAIAELRKVSEYLDGMELETSEDDE